MDRLEAYPTFLTFFSKSRGDIFLDRDFLIVHDVVGTVRANSVNAIDWNDTFNQHENWLRKVVRCRIADPHAVDDVMQEIALSVLRKPVRSGGSDHRTQPAPPENPDSAAAWLYRIAVRKSVDHYRKRKRKTAAAPTEDLEVADSSDSPLKWMLKQEARQNVDAAMKQLSDAEREILMLKFTEHWSYQQIADHLGVTTRSVEHRLLKARNHLRRLLSR